MVLGWFAFSGSAASTRADALQDRSLSQGESIVLDTGSLLLRFELAPGGAVLLKSWKLPESSYDWAESGTPGGINLRSDALEWRGCGGGKGFEHVGHSTNVVSGGGTELQIKLEHTASKLLATLCLVSYPKSPVLDLCLRLRNNGPEPIRNLSRFDPLSLPLSCGSQLYRAHWVTRNAYALHRAVVAESLTIDGGHWNGPDAAGWLALENADQGEFLVAGIEWERQWAFDLERETNGKALRLSAGLRRGCVQDLAPEGSIESPHVFLGLARGDLDDAANATRDYLRDHMLAPAPQGAPFVCYNIWSTEAADVEPRILAEARFAAEQLGVEVFYHDASWYRDSDVANKERWGVGLGSYAEDRRKLPSGLRYLSAAVHGLGLKFGLWVCPEMVDVTVQEREQIPARWMTAARGQPNVQNITGWNPMRMLCLGNPEVERHLQGQLLHLVDEFGVDWLKWDASGLPGLEIVCDRPDHGHQAGNGSQQAVLGKYRILDRLRQSHPDLVLEQCSYGTRLDYGMARHGGRVNWLSDSTAPSAHVRDNVMAAAYVFPSAVNMTWILRDREVTEPQTPSFLDTMFRSRMMGAFGFGTLHGSLTERVSLYPKPVIEAAQRNVKAYKTYRHLLGENAYHLTPWGNTNHWQVMAFASRDQREAVAFYFRNGLAQATGRFALRGLAAAATYDVTWLNTGHRQRSTGAALLHPGLEIDLAQDPQASEVLFVRAASESKGNAP